MPTLDFLVNRCGRGFYAIWTLARYTMLWAFCGYLLIYHTPLALVIAALYFCVVAIAIRLDQV